MNKNTLITLDLDQPLPTEVVALALRQATSEQLLSERGRRNSAARTVRSGGRNGGRPPKKLHSAVAGRPKAGIS